jgi:hypothetical protein
MATRRARGGRGNVAGSSRRLRLVCLCLQRSKGIGILFFRCRFGPRADFVFRATTAVPSTCCRGCSAAEEMRSGEARETRGAVQRLARPPRRDLLQPHRVWNTMPAAEDMRRSDEPRKPTTRFDDVAEIPPLRNVPLPRPQRASFHRVRSTPQSPAPPDGAPSNLLFGLDLSIAVFPRCPSSKTCHHFALQKRLY